MYFNFMIFYLVIAKLKQKHQLEITKARETMFEQIRELSRQKQKVSSVCNILQASVIQLDDVYFCRGDKEQHNSTYTSKYTSWN